MMKMTEDDEDEVEDEADELREETAGRRVYINVGTRQ